MARRFLSDCPQEREAAQRIAVLRTGAGLDKIAEVAATPPGAA